MSVPRSPGTFRAALAPLLPLYALDVLTALTVGMVPPILPLLAGAWGLSAVGAGLINTVYAVGRLAGSYPAARLRVRSGTRAAVFLGLMVLGGGSLGCGLAPAFPVLLAARFLMGVGASAVFLALFGEVLEAAPPAWRGRLANAFEGMSIVSLAAGGVLAAGLARTGGWRAVFLGAGLFLVVGFGLWRPLAPRRVARGEAPFVGERPPGAATRRVLVPICVAAAAMAMTWSGLFTTLVPLLGHARYGLGASALGLALAVGYGAEILGLIAFGLVIDRLRPEPVFLVGAAFVAIGGVVLAGGAETAWYVVGLALVGAGFAGWMIPATVLADRTGTPIPEGYLALYRVAMDAGMIFGPVTLSALAELAGDRLAVGAAGFLLVGGALVLARR